MNTAPRLACQQCKQRKLRCDKGAPCSACRNANLSCQTVQRARLPRGKTGKARTEKQTLESRVAKLESLLEQQKKISAASSIHTGSVGRVSSSDTREAQFVASDFWAALSEGISGLREVLGDSEDEDEDITTARDNISEQADATSHMGAVLLFPNITVKQHPILPVLSPIATRKLLDLYRTRVDTVYKVVHWPTTIALVAANRTGHAPTVSSQALEYAIYFMALCTITDSEAYEMGLGDRSNLLSEYQSAVERLMAGSNLLQHPDVTTLQAFVIYLIGLRTCLNSATTWTLVAVAVRAATALGLSIEDTKRFTAFEIEVQRRLLYAIGILDTHSALDRGTIPIMPSSIFRERPLNINDDDISPSNGVFISSGSKTTDMTHSSMIYEAMVCQRKIYELSNSNEGGCNDWQERLQLVANFGTYVAQVCARTGNSTAPIDILLRISGKKIHVSLELLLRRPPYRQPTNTVPLWDDYDILHAATEVLEQHMQPSPRELSPWAWKNWIQWHALAVVLAELLARPRGPLFDRAYTVAAKSFRYYAQIVADSQSGMLWKPIARLMRRVQRINQGSEPELTQGKTEPSLTIHNTSEESAQLLDLSFKKYDDVFDMSDWNIDGQGTATLMDDFNQADQSHSLDYDQMPWLAWDSFLQDMANTTT